MQGLLGGLVGMTRTRATASGKPGSELKCSELPPRHSVPVLTSSAFLMSAELLVLPSTGPCPARNTEEESDSISKEFPVLLGNQSSPQTLHIQLWGNGASQKLGKRDFCGLRQPGQVRGEQVGGCSAVLPKANSSWLSRHLAKGDSG